MKRLTSMIASIALVGATAMPAPARADANDLARVLAGVAAVAIIAKAIDNRRRDDSDGRTFAGRLGPIEHDDGGYKYYDGHGRRIIDGRIRDYDPHRHGPKAKRGYKKRPLPEACLRTVETRRGDRLAYSARCLERKYRHASKLPGHCETLVRTRRGYRAVFGARCLARDGWRVARR